MSAWRRTTGRGLPVARVRMPAVLAPEASTNSNPLPGARTTCVASMAWLPVVTPMLTGTIDPGAMATPWAGDASQMVAPPPVVRVVTLVAVTVARAFRGAMPPPVTV